MAEQGECHIDAAYGGEDYTAFTVCRKKDGKYYVYGRCWRKHIDDVQDDIIKLRQAFNAGRIHCENNGDKGYLGKALRQKGERVAIPEARKQIASYLHSFKGAARIRVKINQALTYREIEDIFESALRDEKNDC